MALTYLNSQTILDAIMCAWTKQLGGAVNLFKLDLTDSTTGPVLDTDNAQYSDQQIAAAESALVCNLDGAMSGYTTVSLACSYTNTTSETHSTTESVDTGVKFSFTVSQVVSKETAEFSVNFTFSSTDTTTQTSSQTETYSTSVQVWPPPGKVYKAELAAEYQSITIPYTVTVLVTGTTEASLIPSPTPTGGPPPPMNSADAGQAFGWIDSDKCAGSGSNMYSNGGDLNGDGKSVGVVTIKGTVTCSQTTNFVVTVIDYTDTYNQNGMTDCAGA